MEAEEVDSVVVPVATATLFALRLYQVINRALADGRESVVIDLDQLWREKQEADDIVENWPDE